MSYSERTLTGKGDLVIDAWGRQKGITDYSLFHGLFIFNVPPEKWVKYKNGVEVGTPADTVDIYSNNGKLVVKGNGTDSLLISKRHPRYQPNRGHLYSSSVFLPNKTATGIRRFGLFNQETGAFFELENGLLYAVIKTYVDGVVQIDRELINIPFDIDLEKGNIYDIQMQWRGVGNVKFFIGNPATGLSELVHTFDYLGELSELSISNPAMPVGYQAIGNVEILSGCCDLTSEGGNKESKFYSAVDAEETSLTTAEKAVLLVRLPNTIGGRINTRDIVLSRINAYADSNCLVRVYYTRDATAVTATYTNYDGGFQQFSTNGAITAYDKNKMKRIATRRIPANQNVSIQNPDPDNSEFVLTFGDYILVTIQAKNNTFGGASLEYSQEI